MATITSALSPDQLQQRLLGITATDIGAIVGVNPWKRPIDVFAEKKGRNTFAGNTATKWGNLLEPVIRDDYEEVHGVRVEVPGTLIHPKHRWWMATPDGLVYQRGEIEPDRGLEIKVHGRDAAAVLQYGPPGTDEVPAHELLQCMWGMGATGLRRWDEVVFIGGAPVEYIIDRDDELIDELRERAHRFRVDHLDANIPPEVDGSDSWDAYLRARWTKNTEAMQPIDSDERAMDMIRELRAAREAVTVSEAREKLIEQRLKELIGDRAGLSWTEVIDGKKRDRKVTWKFNRPSVATDWRGVADDIRQVAALLMSAKGDEFDRAIKIISSAPEGSTISDGPDKMITGAVVDLLKLARETLTNIATSVAPVQARTTEVPGPRVFLAPRSWTKNVTPNG